MPLLEYRRICGAYLKPGSRLCGALGLRRARHDLDLVGRDDLAAAVHLERDVLELEGPDLVAESVGIETSLCEETRRISCPDALWHRSRNASYLECQPRAHVGLQHFGNGPVEVGQNLHRKLGVDAVLCDQVIERIRQSGTDAAREASRQSTGSKTKWQGVNSAVPATAVELVEVLGTSGCHLCLRAGSSAMATAAGKVTMSRMRVRLGGLNSPGNRKGVETLRRLVAVSITQPAC